MHLSIPALIRSYGYVILFILVGAESMGIPLPGETALVTAAAFAALGHLEIAAVIITAAIAAIIGDNGGYWIGRTGGLPLVRRYGRVLHLNASHIERAQRFFARHGASTVFVGRFIALLRTWAAVLAGVACMPYGTFIVYNALGGIVWAMIFGILGYIFGEHLPTLERYVGQASLALALLLVIVVVLVLLWRHFDLSAEVLWDGAERVWQRVVTPPFVQRLAAHHPKLRAFIVARVTPGGYLGLHLTVGLILKLGALWLLGDVTEDVVHHDPLTRFDVTVMEWFHRHATPLGDRLFVAITNLGSPVVIGALAVGVAVLLLVRRERVLLTAWVVALVGGGLLNEVLKITIRRPRPPYAAAFLHHFSFSFPSGHSISALLGYSMLAYLLVRWLHSRTVQIAVVAIATILIVAIGFSRIYLGVHYFSDVVAGYAAGVVWVAACVSGAEIARRKRHLPPPRSTFTSADKTPGNIAGIVIAISLVPFALTARRLPAAAVAVRTFVLLASFALMPRALAAQASTGRVTVRVTSPAPASDSVAPVAHAVVQSGALGAHTDARGEATLTLPAGTHPIIVARIGFTPDTLRVTMRPGLDTTLVVQLTPRAATLEPVTVNMTRSGGSVANEPTRVQVVGGDEVQEQAAASPGSIGLLLTEARGVRVQPTGAALGNAAVRLQGLRGQYTALLTDGLPLVGATTEGLGVLQLPPVDIQQVEVLAGVASALYGPAALGGVVDLISRRPVPETDLLVNQTTLNGTDAVVWTADSLTKRWGYTLLASGHRQSAQDVNGDGWADVPGYDRAVVRPRLFWAGENGSTALVTAGATIENRQGGTLPGRTTPGGQSFPVDLDTRRFDVGAVAKLIVENGTSLNLRGSGTEQRLTRNFGPFDERDRLTTGFAEASVTTAALPRQVGVAGVAVQYDGARVPGLAGFGYRFVTTGAFLQDTYAPWTPFAFTASARVDHHNVYGTFLSPRLALLVRPVPGWTARLSAGTGFTAPTAFRDETEAMSLHGLHAPADLRAERGRSAALDIDGWLVGSDSGGLEFTATAFGSIIDHPVVLQEEPDAAGLLSLVTLPRPTRTAGIDLVAHFLEGDDLDLIATYSYVRAREPDPVTGLPRDVPLTPRQTGGIDALIEFATGTRLGVEAYYTGWQALENDPYRATSRPYVTVGLLAGQQVGKFQIFADLENVTGVRQTRYDPFLLRAPQPGGRWTTDAWAPLAGRVLNVGIER